MYYPSKFSKVRTGYMYVDIGPSSKPEPDADALGYCRNQLHIRELKGLYPIHKFPLRYHNV